MKFNITFLIPLLLVLSTLTTSLMMYTQHWALSEEGIRNDALAVLKLDITRLQNILYNLLTERAGNLEEARLNLSVTAMDSSIKTLLLVNEEDIVLLSNRYVMEGEEVTEVSDYATDIAYRVIEGNHPVVFFDAQDSALLKGYYPVVLKLENSRGLPVKRLGVLFAEYSIANKLQYANREAINHSLILASVMLAVTLVVAVLLHLLVSRRLGRLTAVSESLAAGNLDARVSTGGNDELAVLGRTFNHMALRLKQDIQRREDAERELRELNETLEQRIIERTDELEEKKLELLDSQAHAHNANKMAALGEMASGIAHEINSPLQIISIIAYKLKRDAAAARFGDVEDSMGKIDNAVSKISNIIGSLQKMSRDSVGDPFEPVQVKEIVEDAIGITVERYRLKGIDFDVRYHDGSEACQLNCQRLQISQVLINLLNNAYDAVLELQERWISLDVFDNGDEVRLTVSDSGEGIAPEKRELIFNPMYTSKDIGKGAGLGLSISAEIARKHGGTLTLDSGAKNTCFVLSLPNKVA